MSRPRAILLDPNEGSLRVGRVLGSRGVSVHALAQASSPGTCFLKSRHVLGAVLPDLPEGSVRWVTELAALADGSDAVLLAGSDATSELLTARRKEIPASLRSFESEDSSHLALMDKASTYALAAEAGVRAPWVEQVTSLKELDAALATCTYPCVVKPILSHVGKAAGGHRTEVVGSTAELRERCSAALGDAVSMLVTEHVPGGEDALEAAITLRLPDGSYPLAYAKRKLRQWPLDVGVGSIHCSTSGEEVIALTQRLLDDANFQGISSVEMKRHAETGELVLIEANVRIPMGFGLGDAAGVDASWRLYAALAGLPLPPQPAPREGMKAVIPHIDLLAVAARVRCGELTLGEAVKSYRGVREVGVLDLRDPGPALALGARLVSPRLPMTLRWRRSPRPRDSAKLGS